MSARLLDIDDYPTALRTFEWKALWELVDGTAERLNLAHECVDRHPPDAVALRIQSADGGREVHTFGALAAWSSRFAHWLEAQGVARGERVAIMLDPSLAFYGALFGAVRRGAIAVPLFTLFGPEGLALRIGDCSPGSCSSIATRSDGGARFPASASWPSTRRSRPRSPRCRRRTRPRPRPTTWPCFSTRRARRARCPRPSSTPTAPSSRS